MLLENSCQKKYIDKELDIMHNQLRWRHDGFWRQCPNIIERVLFASSDLTTGIQICDLYCYPVFHIFKYNKAKDEYWRFKDVTYPKLFFHSKDTNDNPLIDGAGIKFFPEKTKKNFKFYY